MRTAARLLERGLAGVVIVLDQAEALADRILDQVSRAPIGTSGR